MKVTLGPVDTGAGSVFAPVEPIPGDPPPPDDNIGDFFRLDEFRISKTTFVPFEQLDLDWAISQTGSTINLNDYRFALAGRPPQRTIENDLESTIAAGGVHPPGTISGTLQVTLFEETRLWIMGAPRGTNAWQTLGSSISMTVDTSACTTLPPISQEVVDAEVTSELSNLTSSTASVVLRGELEATWTESFIAYDLPLRIVLPTMFNANLDVGLRVGFRVEHRGTESDLDVSIGYSSDVTFSTWENIGSLGIAGRLEEALEGLMPLILECVKSSGEAGLMRSILTLISLFGNGDRLLAVRIIPEDPLGKIEVVVCPDI